MSNLYLASAVFIATHLIPAFAPLRSILIASLGRRLYFSLYGMLSLGVLVWLAICYNNAPYVEVWTQTEHHRWVPLLFMPVVCLLVFIGLSTPNPFSLALVKLGSNQENYDPAQPGIVGIIRHPVIWALAMWATAHVIANGDIASITLFGLLLALTLSGPVSLGHRRKRSIGLDRWQQLSQETRKVSFLGALGQIKFWQWSGSIALYLTLLFLHNPVIGASPLPY